MNAAMNVQAGRTRLPYARVIQHTAGEGASQPLAFETLVNLGVRNPHGA